MSQVVLETLIEPLEARFTFKGSEDGRTLWRQDCFTRFSGFGGDKLAAAVGYLITNRKFSTLPNIAEINDALGKANEHSSKPVDNPDWKKRLAGDAEAARQFGIEFVLQTEIGARARRDGWCRSCADVARSFARAEIMNGRNPQFSCVTFANAEIAYYSRHGQAFNDAHWKQIGGQDSHPELTDKSKAMQGEAVE